MPAPNTSPDANDEMFEEWLTMLIQLGRTQQKVAESLSLLQQKRRTLEEKMIAQYLLHSIGACAGIAGKISSCLEQKSSPAEDLLSSIQKTLAQLEAAIDDLLKSIRYNPNYLEQYFEYNFLTYLTEELRVNEELANFSSQFQS